MPNPPYWNDKITIVNKLLARDSATKIDTYKKTVLEHCFFKQTISRDVTGTTVNLGTSAVCRIPKNAKYKPYHEWKKDITDGFTLSVGDYIFKGEIADAVTAENIVNLFNEHRASAFVIKAVADNSDFLGLGEHYRVEGV